MNAADPMRIGRPTRDPRTDPTRHAYYGGRKKDGSPCGGLVIEGTKTCRMHGGKPARQIRAEGQVRLEVARWTLDGHTELRDPGETLLRLVTQSAARVEMYARLLGEAYEAAERLRRGHEAGALVVVEGTTDRGLVDADDEDDGGPFTEDPSVQTARADLERIFATGGVGALIGVKRDADRFGRVYDTEEAIRGLARLEAEERDRCATFAAKAVAAGLAERQVRLAEAQGAAMFAVFSRVLAALGLSLEDGRVVEVLEREIRGAIGGPVVDGRVIP